MDDDNNSDPVHNTGKGFSIAHLNLQCITNKTDLVKLHVQKERFDIFSFSESWLSDQIPNNMLDIDGYSLIRLDRQWALGISILGQCQKVEEVSGLLLVKTYTRPKNLSNTTVTRKIWKSCGLESYVKIVKTRILASYRPPQGNVQVCVDKLTEIVNDINIDNKSEIYVVDDFNINYLNNHANDTHKTENR